MEKTPPEKQRNPSFVDEVLKSAGQRETEEIHSKIDILNEEVDRLKLQVYESVMKTYVDFHPQFRKSADLVSSVDNVAREMSDVSEKIENKIKSQLDTSTEFLQSLTVKFEEKVTLMNILNDLVKIQDGLETLTAANQSQDFLKATESILTIESFLPTAVKNREDIEIFMALQTEFVIQKENFIFNLKRKWHKELVVIKTEESPYLDKHNYVLEVANGNTKLITEIVMVMERLDILDDELKSLGEKLLDKFLKPCIVDKETMVSDPKNQTLQVTSSSAERSVPPAPLNAFYKVNIILQNLNKSLLHIEVGSPPVSLMRKLGDHIGSAMLEVLVRECLTKAIPTSTKELESFEEVLNQTINFNTTLVDVHFIKDTETSLLDFTQNVGILFANKKCQEILEKARRLMTVDTHNTVQISSEAPLGELPPLAKEGPSTEKVRKMELNIASEFQLSSSTFRLPTCHISVCVQELMSLAYGMLQEATESSSESAVQIFFAVRKIFELFCSVFPTFHKRNLTTFPQLSAIFHNNCMYIAHHLMTMGHQFNKKLPQNINATFVDLVEKVRKLGVQNFLQQLAIQKDQMAEYLEGAKGFANVASEEVQFDVERSVKQTIHQLQHLQKVWQDILPITTYRKAMGTLLNSVVVKITGCIVILEDISSDDARQLVNLLTTLHDKAGPLMTSQTDTEKINATVELQKNVPKWLRFKELITVLDANLMEISDRWADGKGPLANEFSANEVKLLIRALFQNTERRSALLLKIK